MTVPYLSWGFHGCSQHLAVHDDDDVDVYW